MNQQQDVAEIKKWSEESTTENIAAVLMGGLKVFVQIPPYTTRFEASVLGCVSDEYLIFRTARDKASGAPTIPPRVGDKVVVRFLVDGVAYGFLSSVVHAISIPEPLLFMQYPDAIKQVSVRQHKRLACRLPCTLTNDAGQKETVLLLDISEQGAKIACREQSVEGHDSGTPVGLELTLPGPHGMQAMIGKIVRITQQGKASIAGVVFDQPYPELLANLYAILCLDQLL
ncbi:flagellar brake protein [Acidihalobacter yilgarnensis]|uniref:flagellar brake protein n=1 Tax=Acidihalobacter yilgarnensis TaxID=2819280 RepID=UPI0018D3E9B7|nr:flagellar brake protein [Acidihalobacter yilgarnensis]